MRKIIRQIAIVVTVLITCHLSLLMAACSESDDESSDYDNWQERNEAYFATLADSLRQQPQQWVRYKSYSLDQSSEGSATDYIYAKVISQGTGGDLQSPMFTDSVRVSYQGRLIPSYTYPQGYVFDGTAYGTYDSATNATAKMVMAASGSEVLISGWITALLHMHRGDHWRLYIPHQLGYGAQDKSSNGIPAYSTLIFDLTLVDFSPVGQVMPVWQ